MCEKTLSIIVCCSKVVMVMSSVLLVGISMLIFNIGVDILHGMTMCSSKHGNTSYITCVHYKPLFSNNYYKYSIKVTVYSNLRNYTKPCVCACTCVRGQGRGGLVKWESRGLKLVLFSPQAQFTSTKMFLQQCRRFRKAAQGGAV